jgi:putative membrane protein
MMMGRGFAFGYGPYGCGFLPMFLIILLVGIVMFLIIRYYRRKSILINHGSQALEILNERLAKGEITSEEYESIKKIIQ